MHFIARSAALKTPVGFGQLRYVSPGSPLDNKPITDIADQIDAVLACDSTVKGGILAMTYAQWNAVAESLNASFNSVFDTSGWATKLTTGGVRSIATRSYLRRIPGIAPIVTPSGNYIDANTPNKFALNQNYPNPFNPTTTIAFELPYDGIVTLNVYNMLGQEVATLANREEFTEGSNEIEFDASSLASGVYYYRINVNDGQFTQVNKMLLVK